jgi:hypothetical protein
MRIAPLLLLLATGCGMGLTPVATPPATEDAAEEAVCDATVLPPRQLRLLTRRELSNSVNDLFGWSGALDGEACETLTDCAVETQSCEAGVCVADPCTRVSLTLEGDGAAHASVVAAGDFNGWGPTGAEGGDALAYHADIDLWVGKIDVDPGTFAYKLVVDGEWWTDPENPDTIDDGFGGRNSLLTVTCADGGEALDWGATLPIETRPEHYPFDNHADAGLVSSVRAEALLDVAEEIAAAATRDPVRLLGCDPDADAGCVPAWVEDFGRRAWRRPLASDEVDRVVSLVDDAQSTKDGLELAVQVFLASPNFLYRAELGAEASDGTYRLDGHEMASALSYFLWETTPDAALLAAADAGGLDTTEGVDSHARRMLADPRARRALSTFGEQWLGVEKVRTMDRAAAYSEDFGPVVREAMLAEVGATLTYVVFDGSGRLDDVLAGTEYVQSAALSGFYGLGGDGGLVDAGADGRAGVLGLGAVLAATAHSDQTSPVRRGLFVRERLLCHTLGVPPANAGGVPDVDPDASTRERFGQHSEDPTCAACHQHIDPVGFGFEHFDPVGRWRATDAGAPIDAWGTLTDVEGIGTGTAEDFATLHGLAAQLSRSEAAPACFTRQVWRFAVGRDAEDGDCTTERLGRAFEAADHDVQSLVLAVVTSPEFRARRAP